MTTEREQEIRNWADGDGTFPLDYIGHREIVRELLAALDLARGSLAAAVKEASDNAHELLLAREELCRDVMDERDKARRERDAIAKKLLDSGERERILAHELDETKDTLAKTAQETSFEAHRERDEFLKKFTSVKKERDMAQRVAENHKAGEANAVRIGCDNIKRAEAAEAERDEARSDWVTLVDENAITEKKRDELRRECSHWVDKCREAEERVTFWHDTADARSAEIVRLMTALSASEKEKENAQHSVEALTCRADSWISLEKSERIDL